jgi:hypothetical protein
MAVQPSTSMEVSVSNEASSRPQDLKSHRSRVYRASGCQLVFHGPAGVDRLSVALVCPKTAQEGHGVTSSRRDMPHFGGGTAAAIGVSAVAGALGPVRAVAQGASASNASAKDFFYREDWFGEPLAQARSRRPDPRQRGIEHRLVRVDAAGDGREWHLAYPIIFIETAKSCRRSVLWSPKYGFCGRANI